MVNRIGLVSLDDQYILSTPPQSPSLREEASLLACMPHARVTDVAGLERTSSAQHGPLQQGMSAMLEAATSHVPCCPDMQGLLSELRKAHHSNLRLQNGTLSLIASHVRLLRAVDLQYGLLRCAVHLHCGSRMVSLLTLSLIA